MTLSHFKMEHIKFKSFGYVHLFKTWIYVYIIIINTKINFSPKN